MDARWPEYYTRLSPFRALFQTGNPILTYHKFGPRPAGVRLRGLYLRTALFDAQLRELGEAGFGSVPVAEQWRPPAGTTVALTIDDGFRSVLTEALPVLVKHRMMATLYLVADRLGAANDWEQEQGEVAAPLMDVAEVRTWLAAGQRIGAHSLTHPWLTRVSLEQAREEIASSRHKLEDQFGVEVTDFCYPYGDWNPEVRDLVEDAGYRTATTTDFGVNDAQADPLALRRLTARHASRSWRALKNWWRRRTWTGGA